MTVSQISVGSDTVLQLGEERNFFFGPFGILFCFSLFFKAFMPKVLQRDISRASLAGT